jgi:hypothetical protein
VIASGAVTNAKLANSALTISPGTGLTGGGSISLGASAIIAIAAGGVGTTQLADGSVTTAKFNAGAQAPDSAKLAGAPSSDYGAVLSGRINGLTTFGGFGSPSGTSTPSGSEGSVATLSPNQTMVARDLSVKLTAAPGSGKVRQFALLVNGTDIGLFCFVFDLSTSCNSTDTIAVPAGNTLSIEEDSSGGPAAADALFAFRLTPN